jgi:GxxExxY protein
MKDIKEINDITGAIIGSAMGIHSKLGPGLLESVYTAILARDLARAGLGVERERPVGFVYEGMQIQEGFRADLVVEGCVIVEVKSVAQLAPIHSRQLLTYLRLLDCPVGLLLNFNVERMTEGIKRVANGPVTLSVTPVNSV